MMSHHLRKSQEKLLLSVFLRRSRPAALSITSAQHGDALQPFCGALIKTSIPDLSISTQIVPEAIQSKTNKPPTA